MKVKWSYNMGNTNGNFADRKGFSLLHLITRKELVSIIEHYAAVTGLATGVVRMKSEYEVVSNINPDEIPKQFPSLDLEKERLTPVAGHSAFCRMIRSSIKGDIGCCWSDLRCCGEAFQKRRPVLYRCHAGLLDVVTPIRVGSWHVANIYGGQILSDLKEEELQEYFPDYITKLHPLKPLLPFDVTKRHFDELSKRLSLNEIINSPSFVQFCLYINTLPRKSITEIRIAIELLREIVELISRRATEKVTRLVIQGISEEVVAELDMYRGLDVFLKNVKGLIDFDTTSIWFVDHNHPDRLLLGSMDWPYRDKYSIKAMEEGIPIGEGMVGLVANKRRSKRLGNRSLIDKTKAEYFPGSRNNRDLQSICGVPMFLGRDFIGVWEIGSKRENAFDKDDENLLRIFAAQAAIFVRASRDRISLEQRTQQLEQKTNQLQLLRDTIAETSKITDMNILLNKMAENAARILDCRGITIWLFDENRSRIYLRAATGPHKNFLNQHHYYELGEGLTGKVAQTGVPIREKESYNIQGWVGKYPEVGGDPPGRVPLMILPLESRGERLGVVKFARRSEDNPRIENHKMSKFSVKSVRISEENSEEFTEEDKKIAESFCSQLAVVIQNTWLVDRLKTQISHLSHTTISPLSDIKMYANVLSTTNNKEKKVLSLRTIENEIERLSNVIRNIVNYAKSESQTLKLSLKTCNINELLQETITLFELEAAAKNISIEFDKPLDIIEIEIDHDLMKDVFINLVKNAIQAITDETPDDRRKVQLRLENKPDNIELYFKDLGCGIPPTMFEMLFQPYRISTTGGTGIGLAISKRIVEAHNGKLKLVTTSPDNGTEFCITLPKNIE